MSAPRFPVQDRWTLVSRDPTGRFRGVMVDAIARHAHTVATARGLDSVQHKDTRVFRDGSIVVLYDALKAIVEWADATGSTGDVIDDARAAVAMAGDPNFDVEPPPAKLSFADLARTQEDGAKAYLAGVSRAENPHGDTTGLFYQSWAKGWNDAYNEDEAAKGPSSVVGAPK